MKQSRRHLLALPLITFGQVAAAQNQLWLSQFGTTGDDYAESAAPDGSGGVYVSGETSGSLSGPNAGALDAWLARYDDTGNQVWIRQLGTTGDDLARAVAPDGSGGVYVSGFTVGDLGGPSAGGSDAWLARYDGTGNQVWIRQVGTTSDDYGDAVAPDGSGGVYVSGFTMGDLGGPSAGGSDVWLARYDVAGNQLWIRQLGTSSGDFALAAAPDGSSGVFVSGDTHGSLGGPSAGGRDVWLARYDGAGNLIWILQLGTTTTESCFAAASDGSGGVYVSGYTEGSLGGPSAGGRDAWVVHYDGAGNQLWILQLGTTSDDYAYAAALDGSGGVYLGGRTGGSLGGPSAGGRDAWLARYDGAGNQLWILQLGTTSDDYVYAAAPDSSGGVCVSGDTAGSLSGPFQGGFRDVWVARYADDLGTPYCTPATPNSTGFSGIITATGSGAVIDNDLTLIADQLPANQFGYFLAGQTQGFFNPPGSQGPICLTGSIGRYNASSDVIQGPTGSLMLDLGSIPVNPPQAVLPGDTWNFQCWYRDDNPGPTSNFTDAVSVVFQ